MNSSIVIIGSGLAGYTVAKEFRALDKETSVTLITADNGDFYSKPQLSTAFSYKRDASQLVMNTAEDMSHKLNIKILTRSTIVKIDRHAKKIFFQDGELSYSQLILALGAEKLLPPFKGNAVGEVQSVNSLEDYATFRYWIEGKEKIAVIGAGLVGCEFANDLATAGYQVTIVAPEEYPLARFVPEKIGLMLKKALSALGVCWQFGHLVNEVNHQDQGVVLTLDDATKLHVDGVISAVGLRPRTELAIEAGLEVAKGIVVNPYLQTSDESIFALGDCAEVNGHLLLHIAPLLAAARALAKTLTGERTAVHYPAMPIIVKTPACPINVFQPYSAPNGKWHYTGDEAGIEAQLLDSKGKLIGFVVTGNQLRRRTELIKELPDLF